MTRLPKLVISWTLKSKCYGRASDIMQKYVVWNILKYHYAEIYDDYAGKMQLIYFLQSLSWKSNDSMFSSENHFFFCIIPMKTFFIV